MASRFKTAATLLFPLMIAGCSQNAQAPASKAEGAPTQAASMSAPLRFDVREGQIGNYFYRNGPVATHIVLKDSIRPRFIAAFPAGNSGIGLWLTPKSRQAAPVRWQLASALEEVRSTDPQGRPLYGVRLRVRLDQAALGVDQALLSSMRVLRDYEYTQKIPDEIAQSLDVKHEKDRLTWQRLRLDGAPGYRLELRVIDGEVEAQDTRFTLRANTPKAGALTLELTALCGEKPLTPLAANQLLQTPSPNNTQAFNILSFLSYQEKLLAGSWRFNTYFGRDTLMSLRLLMPAAHPSLVEAGLGSVLDRLDTQGGVAHEEDIGEFAVLRRRQMAAGNAQKTLTPQAAGIPLYDYKMVDDDFMLLPVLAHYWQRYATPAKQQAAFLARKNSSGQSYASLLGQNIDFVLRAAAPFSQKPEVKNLVRLQPGEIVGEWRDSHDGLAGGVYAYNVNGILVPAALEAIDTLGKIAEKQPQLAALLPRLAAQAAQARKLLPAWHAQAGALFNVTLPTEAARTFVAAASKAQGLNPNAALASLQDAPSIRFASVALTSTGTPLPVLNSDDGFALLFLTPKPDTLAPLVQALMRPYPAGLMTDVGMVVANAAYASPAIQSRFTNQFYHGAVVWSWQQALMAAGLARQLERTDLPQAARQALLEAQRTLWRAIGAGRSLQTSELWSWRVAKGDSPQNQFQLQPFGQRAGDQTESNAAQLWSTVYLSIEQPL